MGLSKETTWGTPVTASSFIELMSEGLTEALDRFDTRNIFNGIAEPDDTTGLVRVEGDTVFAAFPDSMGFALNAALGSLATTSISATLKSHVFQCLGSDVSSLTPLPPYTVEIFRDVTSAQQYAGCVANQMTLAAQVNQDLRATLGWIGKQATNKARIAAASVIFPTSPSQPFTFDTSSVQWAGAASDLIESFSLEVQNNLESVAALNNSNKVARIQRTNPVSVMLSGQMSFNDITEYEAFRNQTEFAFAASFKKANSHSLILSLPRCVYTAYPLGQQGRNRLTVAFEAKARVPTGSTSAIAATLVNQSVTY
ncbi:MAG: hypothetical protein HC889_00705 [Synechococcaceae cyanobacterium SM1_2_3]|nr:hypothetical protein [Synechococcaceae cyanobacterium SM1_2_3]